MPRTKSQEVWRLAHPEKIKEQGQRYLANNDKITITIKKEFTEMIDTVRDPSESRSQWVRRIVLEKLSDFGIQNVTES